MSPELVLPNKPINEIFTGMMLPRRLRFTFLIRMGVLIGLMLAVNGAFAARVEIRGAWSPNLPYQYETFSPTGGSSLSGFDIEVMKVAARRAGFRPTFEEHSWDQTLQGIRGGTLDFALAATPEASRREWAWFTVPYRQERTALFTRRGTAEHWQAETALASVRRILEEGGRVALMRGFDYGPELAALRKDERYRPQWQEMEMESELLTALLNFEVEGFLAEQLAAASEVVKADALNEVDRVPGMIYETPLSLMLSKQRISEAQVAALDQSLNEMKSSGELARISRNYLVPHLLLMMMQTVWFRTFDVIGTIAFAISGVLIARRERYDLIGACVLAALPAVGGGVMRDLISGRSPIGIVQSPSLLLMVFGTVLVGWLFFTVRDEFFHGNKARRESAEETPFHWISTRGMLEVSDAIGLATFTIVGVVVAIQQHCEPLWLWGPVMAAVTAAGGGVLRDVLRSQSDIPSLKGSIYPEVAIFWGWIYSLVILQRGPELSLKEVLVLTITVLVAAFLTRILAVQFRWRSLFLGRGIEPINPR